MPKAALREALAQAVARVAPGAAPPLTFERPRDAAHGDYASNVAMLLAKSLGMRPLAVAEALAAALPASPAIARVTAAAPGFLNFRISDAALAEAIARLLAEPPSTGPLPAGALARLDSLEAMRREVHREALAGLLKSAPDCDEDHAGVVGPVRLLRDGKPAGALSPGALVAEVGEAATRLPLLTRQLDRPIEVDLAQAVRETADNPSFYLGHAHARLAGIMRLAAEAGLHPEALAWGPASVAGLVHPEERALLLLLAASAEAFAEAAAAGLPHRAIRHALEVAEAFHRFYTVHRVLGETGPSPERLVLVAAARRVLRQVLERVVRVPAPEAL